MFLSRFRPTPLTLEGAIQLYFKLSGFVADVMTYPFSLQLQTDTNFFHGVGEIGMFAETVYFYMLDFDCTSSKIHMGCGVLLETVCFFICWISIIKVILNA